MNFSDVNLISVLITGIALFILGAIWWGPKTLFPIWWKLMGHENKSLAQPVDPMSKVFGLTAVSTLVQALFLSSLISALKIDSASTGFITGLFIGFGISAIPTMSNRLFANAAFNKNGLKIWAIEALPNTINFGIASAILVALT